MKIKELEAKYDKQIAKIIRDNFESHNVLMPGTAYYDPELDCLSEFYYPKNETVRRKYFILLDDEDNVLGGAGFAEFVHKEDCAELQKLYIADSIKGQGYSKKLISLVEKEAKAMGYTSLYIETISNFAMAVSLYEKLDFKKLERPSIVSHEAMDRFFIKDLL